MAKWGRADYEQLKALQAHLQKLQSVDLDTFCRDCSKELAARLLALVIPRTPVGDYPKETGKKGGTLRRGWTAGKDVGKTGKGTSAAEYAKSLPIEKAGHTYTITVINPVEYASYVEFGHRQTPGRFVPAIGKQLKASWVDGKYMLTASEEDLERIAPKVLQQKLDAFLREVLSGD